MREFWKLIFCNIYAWLSYENDNDDVRFFSCLQFRRLDPADSRFMHVCVAEDWFGVRAADSCEIMRNVIKLFFSSLRVEVLGW